MSVPLVPAPVHAVVGGGSFALTSGEVGAPPQLAGVIQLFVDEVARESGISLTVASSDSALPVITVELSSEGLNAVASASGNRADGNAARTNVTASQSRRRACGSGQPPRRACSAG